MSGRPRAPLALRGLAKEPTLAPEVELDAPETRRLADPPVPTRERELAPPTPTATADLPRDVRIRHFDLAPPLDVVPATLRTQVFALRSVAVGAPPPQVKRAKLLEIEARRCPIPALSASRSELVPAVRQVLLRATPTGDVPVATLRSHLTALFRASGAPSPGDLALVGVYERAPLGAIAGIAVHERGLQVRLRPLAKARAGTLVVGRMRAGGALVSAEIPT